MVTNPHVLEWTNPTLNTDNTAFDAANAMVGVTVYIDSLPAVSVPIGYANTLNLEMVSTFTSLPTGNHTLGLAVVAQGGTVGIESSTITFLRESTPAAPTNLILS